MRKYLIAGFLFFSGCSFSQQQTYDMFRFTAPKKWVKKVQENNLIFSVTDSRAHTWAQIDIVKSTASKGSMEADFESEWKSLVTDRYGVAGEPLEIDTQSYNGWKVWSGLGKFVFNNDTSSVLLSTFSNGIRCASFILLSNTTSYGKILEEFVGSVTLVAPPTQQAAVSETSPQQHVPSVPVATGFQFNTTNFDDGWVSVVKEDWVEATKGNIKVLLHYPREEDKKYYTQYSEQVSVFWNLLVAPRYSNLRHYYTPTYMTSSQPGYFAAGLLTDNATGKDVWVALFSKEKSGWIEIITPDKKTFVDNFGVDEPQQYFGDWDRLSALSALNKFAVGEKDLEGEWSNNFFGSTSYYNVYSGIYAGSTTFTSNVTYQFSKNKTYNWHLAMGNGATGSTTRVDQAKASGKWKMLNNWQLWCSEIEREQKTYNVYFSCIKGGRVLWMQDISYGSYTAYGKIK